MAAALAAVGRNTLVEGETDSRPMGFDRGPKPPSYNVQTAVDADTGLIVHHTVTNEPNDTRQLHPMAKAAKEVLGVERLTVATDAGYSNGAAVRDFHRFARGGRPRADPMTPKGREGKALHYRGHRERLRSR